MGLIRLWRSAGVALNNPSLDPNRQMAAGIGAACVSTVTLLLN
jgi:hypothetical protein